MFLFFLLLQLLHNDGIDEKQDHIRFVQREWQKRKTQRATRKEKWKEKTIKEKFINDSHLI